MRCSLVRNVLLIFTILSISVIHGYKYSFYDYYEDEYDGQHELHDANYNDYKQVFIGYDNQDVDSISDNYNDRISYDTEYSEDKYEDMMDGLNDEDMEAVNLEYKLSRHRSSPKDANNEYPEDEFTEDDQLF
ncbi:unnamed protein product [Heterobilharzia americana]|nr:unnamed protein product [Heterobilharzia americana]